MQYAQSNEPGPAVYIRRPAPGAAAGFRHLGEGPGPDLQQSAYLTQRACPVLSFYADPQRPSIETELFSDERSRSIGWEGAGHWLHQERPIEFNTIVSRWLESLDA